MCVLARNKQSQAHNPEAANLRAIAPGRLQAGEQTKIICAESGGRHRNLLVRAPELASRRHPSRWLTPPPVIPSLNAIPRPRIHPGNLIDANASSGAPLVSLSPVFTQNVQVSCLPESSQVHDSVLR